MDTALDHADTIVAISSANGRSALSIVRLSGSMCTQIADQLLSPAPVRARHATLTTARHPETGIVLDQLIAVRYDAPASYTGEPMLELTCHGGPTTSRVILASCLALGARVARGGEFTRRALLNGKLDLAQAEAVADLIDATSEPMRRIALGTVGGGLSKQIGELRAAIVQLEALMAYSVDFPEEDDGMLPPERTLATARDVETRINALLRTAARGTIIREGALVVLAGAPNVGKSTLFNALLGQDRAIVTEIPGTTRDAIEHPCLIGEWPVRLVDTAGLRSSSDLVERLGIEVSERYLTDADLAIVCTDGHNGARSNVEAIAQRLGEQRTLFVETKVDLRRDKPSETGAIWVSAKSGTGLPDLRSAIAERLDARYGRADYENPVITHARHANALERAATELGLFIHAMQKAITPAIATVHLRTAAVALEEIIGAVSVDDLLNEVFSRFCIGK